jgi:hypothetical protein
MRQLKGENNEEEINQFSFRKKMKFPSNSGNFLENYTIKKERNSKKKVLKNKEFFRQEQENEVDEENPP